MIYLAIIISSGIAIERTIVNAPAWKNAGIDEEFNTATKDVHSLRGKRGVFGQDDKGKFFSLYEKDPNHSEKTIVKFIRANNDRPHKDLLEYFEYEAGTVRNEMQNGRFFRLRPNEIKKRLAQNGPTY